jgi:ATP-dependent DNA ligase
MSLSLPTLYKKASTGKIQQWNIHVEPGAMQTACIVTQHGQVGGKIQETKDWIEEGKNLGKANETSELQQAEAEAKAKWEKKKKSGYVETLDGAEADETDDLIEGGIVPMLAQSFSKHAQKIKYPCYAQPKLDGIRCIAILKDGECTLWSRTRKLITGVPHIAREVEKMFKGLDIVLDGELYNHELKKDFEQIVSFVRQEEPQPGYDIVEYHIYDVANGDMFHQRWENFIRRLPKDRILSRKIHFVETVLIDDEPFVAELFEKFTASGYEGLMLRNYDSKYVNKRSYDLQKVKEFEDAEFKIVGIKEGRGKLAGHAIHVCEDEKGEQFDVKMKGETAVLKKHFDDHSLWKGKKMTVQFQGLTGANQVPRFPVGKAVRDYE